MYSPYGQRPETTSEPTNPTYIPLPPHEPPLGETNQPYRNGTSISAPPDNRQTYLNGAYNSASITPPPGTRQNHESRAYDGASMSHPPESYPPCLNEAYNGPSIPPRNEAYQNHQDRAYNGPSVPPPREPYQPQPNGAYNGATISPPRESYQPHLNGAYNAPPTPREAYQPYVSGAYNVNPVPALGQNQQTYANGAYNGPSIPHPGVYQQPYQNGAYQGASVPPPSNNDYRRGQSGGGYGCSFFSCCCNMFTSCCGCLTACLCTCICQIIIVVLIIAAIILFIGWLIFRPKSIIFYANDALLTEFNLNDNMLSYNLALNYTIRNPNQRMGIYYDQITADAFYHDQGFATVELPGFYQRHNTSTSVSVEFRGQNNFDVPRKKLSKINKERGSAVYGIDVKFQPRIWMKFLFIKLAKMKPRAECELRIPLNSDGKASKPFEPTGCSFHWFKYLL